MAKDEYIRAFDGHILGIITTESNGDQTAREFPSRRVLGYYRAKYDHTTDFFGKVIAKGNAVAGLIYNKQ